MPSQQRSLFSRIARGVAIALGGLAVLVLLAAGAGALWLSHADLKPIVEREATEALGRRVTLGTFQVRWGDPLAVDLTDLVIPNAPWGSKPEMARVGRLSALLDVAPLLHGVLRYQKLRLSDVTVVLERDASGIGNWKFGGSAGPGGLGLVPKNRTQFPTLIDFAGERSLITYRSRSGNLLRIALDHVEIASSGDDTPSRLIANGAYNDVVAHLDAATESYTVLRDAGQPFGARFTLAGDDTDIAFDGTLQEPLDFDGVSGRVSIEARTLNDILGAMGSKAKVDLPLSVAGMLKHDGDHWSLATAKGHVRQSDFSGDLALREGAPGAPDDIGLDLTFDTLDLDAIAAAFNGGKEPDGLDAMKLHPDGLAAVDVSAALTASAVTVARQNLQSVTLQGRLAGGDVALKELSFALGGGTLAIAGSLEGGDADSAASLQVSLSKAQVSAIAKQLGASGDEIHGVLNGAATLDLRGGTVGAALKNGGGAAVIALRDGSIARSVIEKVSVDLRRLFRSEEGQVPVSCLLGVATLKDGIALLAPLRLESRDAIVVGAGRLDLLKSRLDLTVKTERDSTNFFALDLPIRISGPLEKVSAEPLAESDENWLKQSAASSRALPPALRRMADSNPCQN